MSPAAIRIFKLGLAVSIVVGVAALGAGVWAATRSPFPECLFEDSLPIGDKELVGYRQGADFRISTMTGMPILNAWTPVPRESRDKAWGRPNHWLKVPHFSLSLWWPFTLSCVLPSIWVLRRRRPSARGFPVAAVRRAT
jgi:hypothetical protein